MKTLYMQTNRFVRREGNVIDFTEYRQRMLRSRAVGDEVSFHWEVDESVWHQEDAQPPVCTHRPRPRHCLADALELCASLGALVLVLTVWLQFLL